MNPNVIVCLVDRSAKNNSALRRASALARWYGSALHAVSVQTGRRSVSDGGGKPRVATFAPTSDAEGVDVTPVVLYGDTVKAVADYTRTAVAALLVVGQNRQPWSRYWSRGSLAAALDGMVACPTLMIPALTTPSESDPTFRNIVCGVDFSVASLRAMDQALDLAQASGGRITLVQALVDLSSDAIYSGGEAMRFLDDHRKWSAEAEQKLHALVPPDALFWCDLDTVASSGLPHQVILRTASQQSADLIVIGSSKPKAGERIVMSSVVKDVLRGARVPVLTVPWLPDAGSGGVDSPT